MQTTMTEQWRTKQRPKSHDAQNLRQTNVKLPTPKELNVVYLFNKLYTNEYFLGTIRYKWNRNNWRKCRFEINILDEFKRVAPTSHIYCLTILRQTELKLNFLWHNPAQVKRKRLTWIQFRNVYFRPI